MVHYSIMTIIVFITITISCTSYSNQQIVVFHAGSLSPLFVACKNEFEKRTGYTLLLEASGSVDAARKIIDLKKKCDVIALSDVALFEDLLSHYCQWWIGFAGNEMVLAYSPHSTYAMQISADWLHALRNHQIMCARSDPLRDPCGYRTLIVWKLLSRLYRDSTIEAVCAMRAPRTYIRATEIEAMMLVEAGVCDAIWVYKSLAVQRGLPYVQFDKRANLGSQQHASYYSSACVELTDNIRTYTLCGNAILYAVGVPTVAMNSEGAISFIQFLLSHDAKQLILRHGFVPCTYVKNHSLLPKQLQAMKFQ